MRTIAMFDVLFPWVTRKRETLALALRTEARVRQLNGLPPAAADTTPGDVMTVLESTNTLLDRVADRPEGLSTVVQSSGAEQHKRPSPSDQMESSHPMQEVEEAQDMSSAAKELIKLRDWVSLAQTGQHPITPEVLEEVYRELGRILAQEHVMSLEDIGPYDVNRQRVVDTRETDDLAQDDTVCHTVRPGYIFHGKLVRPQDVIVYAYKSSTVRAPSSESDGS